MKRVSSLLAALSALVVAASTVALGLALHAVSRLDVAPVLREP
ncbi:MAG TPA: hypothetical protein VFG94_11150 [Acidimicrobiales bacterium]|nr:hypothetical protein [Acidimicrobiales bacterium]